MNKVYVVFKTYDDGSMFSSSYELVDCVFDSMKKALEYTVGKNSYRFKEYDLE